MEDTRADEVELSEAELDAIFGGHKASVCRCAGRNACICPSNSRCDRVCVA
jgi:hypothetical protein